MTLESWRAGPARDAVVAFVASVTSPGPGFVPESGRIATFDNDGTLWCEKPFYVQADFVLRKWRAMAADDPSLAARQPYKALVENDREWLAGMLDHVPELVRGVSEAFGGKRTGVGTAGGVTASRIWWKGRAPVKRPATPCSAWASCVRTSTVTSCAFARLISSPSRAPLTSRSTRSFLPIAIAVRPFRMASR
jgi:hypothetical protein